MIKDAYKGPGRPLVKPNGYVMIGGGFFTMGTKGEDILPRFYYIPMDAKGEPLVERAMIASEEIFVEPKYFWLVKGAAMRVMEAHKIMKSATAIEARGLKEIAGVLIDLEVENQKAYITNVETKLNFAAEIVGKGGPFEDDFVIEGDKDTPMGKKLFDLLNQVAEKGGPFEDLNQGTGQTLDEAVQEALNDFSPEGVNPEKPGTPQYEAWEKQYGKQAPQP